MLWLGDVYGGRSFISGPGGCDKSCPQAEVGGPTAVRAAFLEAKPCAESGFYVCPGNRVWNGRHVPPDQKQISYMFHEDSGNLKPLMVQCGNSRRWHSCWGHVPH